MSTHRVAMNASEKQSLYNLVLDMFARVDLTLPTDDVTRLVDDLALVCTDEPEWNDEPFEDVYREWARRIGGRQNMIPYLATLRAGDRRRR